jgi:hypothetical protein
MACVRPENMRLCDEVAGALEGVVELGMPLGATIVHEIRTAGGLRLKLSEPRAPGTGPRETGARVWIRPVSPERHGVRRALNPRFAFLLHALVLTSQGTPCNSPVVTCSAARSP